MERFRILDAHKKTWGKLVKKWAKGEQKTPRTLEELIGQCFDEDPDFKPIIPDYVKGLVFVQNDKHVLTIRLPPAELVIAGEQDFANNPSAAYPLPDFYAEFFRVPPPIGDDKLELQAARIGEYSVNSCA